MKEFVLRESPEIKIVIFKERLELHEPGNQITEYVLKDINSFQITKRVNWLVSLLSFVIGVFTETSSEIYKERDQMEFNYEDKPILVSFKGGDQDKAIKAANRINQFVGEAFKTK